MPRGCRCNSHERVEIPGKLEKTAKRNSVATHAYARKYPKSPSKDRTLAVLQLARMREKTLETIRETEYVSSVATHA